MLNPNSWSEISYQQIFKNFQNEAVNWIGLSKKITKSYSWTTTDKCSSRFHVGCRAIINYNAERQDTSLTDNNDNSFRCYCFPARVAIILNTSCPIHTTLDVSLTNRFYFFPWTNGSFFMYFLALCFAFTAVKSCVSS